MGEQEMLSKGRPARRHEGVNGNPCQRFKARFVLPAPGQRDKASSRRHPPKAMALRFPQGQIAGDFRQGKASRGQHHLRCRKGAAGGFNPIAALGEGMNRRHLFTQPNIHPAGIAVGEEHGHDVLRAVITKQLAEGLLVIGNARGLHHLDEVFRREAL